MSAMDTLIAYTSGNALGEPGKAAAAAVVTVGSGEIVTEVIEPLGNGTPNFAAYYGVLLALQLFQKDYIAKDKKLAFIICLDNIFVYEQLAGTRPMKEPGLVPLFIEIHNLRIEHCPDLSFKEVSTFENQKAIKLVTKQLELK